MAMPFYSHMIILIKPRFKLEGVVDGGELSRTLLLKNFEECEAKKSQVQVVLLKREWIVHVNEF
jgi:hypothetical protein